MSRYIECVRLALWTDFVPLHYGFSDKHFVKCDDGVKRKFTKELVFGELSSWISLKIADRFWDRVKIIAVGDGTYIYSENFGGFLGNKELFSGHKLRCLQKVMCLGTTRGYWVKNFAGYGGSGRYSDKKLLDYIISDLEEELEEYPNAKNFINFFDLKADTSKEHVLVVDRGFEGAEEKYMTFVAPRGKVKSREDGKTTIAKQHTAKQAALNRTVTRVRNIIERMFSTSIKTWGVLGGRLHFAYFEYIPQYMDIACAISNAFRGCLDVKKGAADENDFKTMTERISHENEIQKLLKRSGTNRFSLKRGKFERFNPEEECKKVPEMSEDQIRDYACGPYAMKLSSPYVKFWSNLDAKIKYSFFETSTFRLIKVSGLKSRFSPRLGREVYLLFKGGDLELQDTLCSCHGGLRPIGGCAHAIAVLRLLGQLTQRIIPEKISRSEQMLKRGLWYLQNSDSESEPDAESSNSDSSGSEEVN